MVMTLENKRRFAFSKNHGTRKTTLLTILCVWWVLTWTGAQATRKWQNPETSEMEDMRTKDPVTQNKNVRKETHEENSHHPSYFANAGTTGSNSHRKTTVSSVSTAATTQATSSRTTRTTRPNSNSSLNNTPSKPDLPTVIAKLVFNCSFPVPSESLVLNAIATLLNSRSSSISNTVKVLGFFYTNTSGDSYEVVFIMSVNVTMPDDFGHRKNINKQIQKSIDNTLNRLLNEPKAESFESQSTSFRDLEIDIEYSFGCGHYKPPVSFLNELSASETTTTQVENNNPTTKEHTTFTPTPTGNTNIPKAIVIHIKIEFTDLTIVPSEDEVLTTIDAEWNIRKTRELGTQIPENAVSIQGISYEKTGSNSYSIDFEYRISKVPENINQAFETYNSIQNTTNLLLSSILNGPNPGQFTYPQVTFSGNSTTIVAFQVYVFNENDIKTPSGLLVPLLIINGHAPTTAPTTTATTTTTPTTTATTTPTTTATTTTTTVPATISLHRQTPSTTTSAEILTRLVFSNSSPLPCESMVISAIQTLLKNQGITFPDKVIVMNYTYEKISDTSYAINITFNMTNIRMHGNDACRKELGDNIKSSVNNAINELLNKPVAKPFEEVNFDFSGCSQKPIHTYMEYSFHDGTNLTPARFIKELGTQSDSACPKSNPVIPTDHPSTIIGDVYIFITVIFENLTNVPTEAEVVSAANALLESKIRTKRDLDTQILNEPVSIKNITYQKTGSNSYSIDFAFQISNVSIAILLDQRNQTYDLIQYKINSLMNTILNYATAASVNFTQANYQGNGSVINAFQTYIYKEGDINSPSMFLHQLLILHNKTPPATTTTGSHLIPIDCSGVVQTRLVFNLSSSALNVSEVFSKIAALNSTLKNITEHVTVLNITYEGISNISTTVTILFKVCDIDKPTGQDHKNTTYNPVGSTINDIVNTLLNDTGAGPLQPSITNFKNSKNKVDGYMEYHIPSIPAKTENAPTVATSTTPMQTTPGSSPTTYDDCSGVVQTRLVFNLSSSALNVSEVFSKIAALNSTLKNITEHVTVLNITYEGISNISTTVTILFKVCDIDKPTGQDHKNTTYNPVGSTINDIVNTLLNDTGAGPLQPSITNFKNSKNKVDGYMEYHIPSIPAKTENAPTVATSTTPMQTTPGSSPTTYDDCSGVVQTRLVFNLSSSALNVSEVFSKIAALNSTLKNITEHVTVLNITYEGISNISTTVTILFKVCDIDKPTGQDHKNTTYNPVGSTINDIVNTLLNDTGAGPLQPSITNFKNSKNKVDGYMEYHIPSIPAKTENAPTVATSTTPMQTTPGSSPTTYDDCSGVVQTRLVFNLSSSALNVSEVFSKIAALNSTLKNITEHVTVLNITYEGISNISTTVTILFKVCDIDKPTGQDHKNTTYNPVGSTINDIVNTLLNDTGAGPLQPSITNFKNSKNKVDGYMEYHIPSIPAKTENAPTVATSTTPMQTTPGSSPTTYDDCSGVVQTRLVFNLSSSALNVSEVFSKIAALNSTLKNITEHVTVLNITYEGISNISTTVTILFKVCDIDKPTGQDHKNTTYNPVGSTINDIVNTLLNDTGAGPLQPSITNFKNSKNKVDGYMEYHIPSIPAKTENAPTVATSTTPMQTTPGSSPTTYDDCSGVVQTRLVFNLSSSALNVSEVFSKIAALNSTLKNITEHVTVLNITYEGISNNSTTVTILFKVCDIDKPTGQDHKNTTYNPVGSTINDIVNTLLNDTGAGPLQPSITNFKNSKNKVDGYMEYHIPSIPAKTENAPTVATSTTPMQTTPGSSPTTYDDCSGVVQTRLVFNLSSSALNVSEVFSKIAALNSTLKNITEHVTVLNITYEGISNISTTVTILFKVCDIDKPTGQDHKNTTYNPVGSTINDIVNTLLNDTGAGPLQPSITNFKNSKNKVDGYMEYHIPSIPAKTENAPTVATSTTPMQTTPGSSPTTYDDCSGVVQTRLVFNLSSSALNVSEVFSKIAALNSTLKNITEHVTVLNITYEGISNNSTTVTILFKVCDIDKPTGQDHKNTTYNPVGSTINDIVNTLLNDTGAGPLQPSITNFKNSKNKVDGYMEYHIPSIPAKTENAPTVATSTTPMQTTPGSSPTTYDDCSGVVQTRLVFNLSSSALNVSEVFSKIAALNSTLKNITEHVTVLNITYEGISNNSTTVTILFKVCDIDKPTGQDHKNTTYNPVGSTINDIVNTLLNDTGAGPLQPSFTNFTSSKNKVDGYMEYNIPSIPAKPGTDTAPTVPASTTPTQTSPGPSPTMYNNGSAVVQTRLVFNSPSPFPSKSEVLSFIEAKLNSTLTNFADPVTVLNIAYEEISNASNAVIITFKVSNISIPTNPDLMNNTYNQVESIINGIVNILLKNYTSAVPLQPTTSNFTSSEDEVNGYMEYNIPSMPSPPVTDTAPMVPASTTPTQTSPGPSPTMYNNGSAVVQTRLVFNSSSPVPSKSEVLSVIEALLNSTLTNLTDLVTVLNITYEEISNASYAVIITFKVSNISIPTNPDLMNNTYNQVESIINGIVNVLLKNYTTAVPLVPSTSNFTSSDDEVNGYLEYNIPSMPSPPVTDTAPTVPASTTPTQTSPGPSPTMYNNGSAVVQTRLVFNSSSPVPSKSEVLSAIEALLNSTLTNLTDLVTVLNITYEEISNASYAVIITFKVSNISIPTNPDLMNNTYNQVESIINGIVNVLLKNYTTAVPLVPSTSNFMSSDDEVNGYMVYNIPSMHSPPGTDTAPTVPASTTPTQTSPGPSPTMYNNGSAVVQTRLVFNSSSPVPSKSEVLSAIEALLNSTLTNLTDLVTVLNITYEEISNSSNAVIITFKVSNLSIPTNPNLMNNTYNQVESIINGIVSVLLKNYTSAVPLQPTTSNFTSSEDEVNGYMEYNIPSMPSPPVTDTAPTVPASTTPTQTSPGPSPTMYNNGSAVVQTRLVFNSSSPVPSKSEVLSVIEALLNSTLTNLTDLVTVLNITYEEISNASYAVIITFKVSNISIPTNPDLMNNIYNQVESIINGIVNVLLKNYTSAVPLVPSTSNFTSSDDEVNGYMEYNIPSMPSPPVTDTAPTVPASTTPTQTSPGPSPTINGSAVVQTRLVFNSSSPVPSKSEVLSAIEALLNSTLTNLTDLVTVLNITYEEISNSSNAVIITFKVSNLSIPTNPKVMNNTYNQVESIINGIVNVLLKNYTSAVPLQPTTSNFTSSEDEVNGYMEYNIPSMPSPPVTDTAPTVPASTTPTQTSPGPSPTMYNNGSAVVQTRLVFNSSSPVPSKSEVLSVIEALLNSTLTNLTDLVTVLNITYEEISNASYAVIITFKVSNISIPTNPDLMNNIYNQVESIINGIVNVLLKNYTSAVPLVPSTSNFTSSDDEVNGYMEYNIPSMPSPPVTDTAPTVPASTTPTQTSPGPSPTMYNNGSAVVQTRLVFNSSSPVPSKSEVLSAIEALLNSTLTNLTDLVTVLNITYEEISNSSNAVIITFKVSNLSIPTNPKVMNNTYNQVESIINGIVNVLLKNYTSAVPLQPTTSNFTSSEDEVNGYMEYNIPSMPSPPVNDTAPTVPASTTPTQTSPGPSPTMYNNGSAVVQTRLVFNSSSPVPSKSEVLSAIEALLNSTLTNLTDLVTVLNITYEEISNSSNAVIITFKVSNLSIPTNPNLMNNTYNQVESIINGIVNVLLKNYTSAVPLVPSTSNFTSSDDEVNGYMVYNISSMHSPPGTDTAPTVPASTTPTQTSPGPSPTMYNNGSAVVQTRLVFNSSSPVPSKSEVLSAIEALLNSTLTNLTDLVTVLNITYEEISNASNTVIITFKVSNISIPTNPDLMNNTYNQVESIINGIVNVLLKNYTSAVPLVPSTSNFTSSDDEVNGYLEYNIPSMPSPPVTDTAPTVPSSTTPTQTSPGPSPTMYNNGSAVVQTRLVFNSSSPVPSKSEVLSAIEAVLNSTLTNLTDLVTVLNITYEEISNASYAVIITFKVSNISIPTNPDLMNNTYNQVESIINGIVNVLLKNYTTAVPLVPSTSNFMSSDDEVNGYMVYNIPSMHSPPGTDTAPTVPASTTPTQTSPGPSPTMYNNGSAVVQTRLVFNSSSPVPSKSEVLSAIEALLNSTLTNLTDLVTVLNITYEEISNSSNAVIITFKVSNLSIPTNPNLMNNTYNQVESIINGIVSVLLKNYTSAVPLQPTTSNFTSSEDEVNGYMEYNIPSMHSPPVTDTAPTVPASTTPTQTSPGPSPTMYNNGSAVVQTRLVFNSSSPVPSKSEVLSAIEALLNSTLTNLTDLVTVLNITYEEISNASYAVIITFKVSNISIPTNPNLMNNTYNQVESIINGIVSVLLKNYTSAVPLQPTTSNFTSSEDEVNGYMEYNIPSMPSPPVTDTAPTVPASTTPTQTSPGPSPTMYNNGSAVVQTRLVFNSSSPVPSKSEVLSAIEALLNSTLTNLTDLVTVLNITYEEISNASYAVIITFKVSNISIPTNPDLMNNTYNQVESIINGIVNVLLKNYTTAVPLVPSTSNFMSSDDEVNGYMVYNIPSMHSPPGTDTAPTVPASTTPTQTSPGPSPTMYNNGSAVVQTRLVFNSSSPVPSKSEVLSAIEALLNSTLTNLTDLVTVLNITYEEISNSSNAVIITFKVSNLSIPTNPNLMNNTYNQVESIINGIVSVLLKNYTSAVPLQPTTSNFTSSEDEVNGYMEYNIPSMPSPPVTDTAPTVPASTTPTQTSPGPSPTMYNNGSAVVQTRLVFNSSSPVPSKSEVLSAIEALLNSTLTNLTDLVTVLNITYEEISNASYAVIITFKVSNISIPTNPDLMNNTYNQVESIINGIVNVLLKNYTTAVPLVPSTSNFMSSDDEVNGYMVYNIPSMHSPPGTDTAPTVPASTTPTQTSPGPSPTMYNNGSAVVQTRLVFNSSSPVPSKCEVLSAIEALLNSTLTNLTDLVTVLNITYEEISNSSNAVIITFKVSNLSIPTNPNLMNNTYNQVESIINGIVSVLLKNYTSAVPLQPTTSNFTSSEDEVNGYMEYNIPSMPSPPVTDTAPTVPASTTPTQTSPGPSPTMYNNGSAVVQTRLVFNSSSPVPSKSEVLSAIEALLNSTLTNLTDLVTVLNITYEEISNASYAVIITFKVSNISIPTNPDLLNNTYNQVESIINGILNVLLKNYTSAVPLVPSTSNFMSSDDEVNGYMVYNIPSMHSPPGTDTAPTVPASTTPTQTSPGPSPTMYNNGSAVVQTRLVFNSSSPVPSKSEVLSAIEAVLNSTLTNLTDLVTVLNITYEEISNASYAVIITFKVSNISIPTNPDLMNNTYNQVESIINGIVNVLLKNYTTAVPLVPSTSNFMSSDDEVNGYMVYNIPSMHSPPGTDTAPTVPASTTPMQTTPGPSPTIYNNGSAVVQTRLVFNSPSPVPSTSEVLSFIEALLNSTLTNLADPVTVLNITYEEISNTSNAVIFTFKVNNISIPTNPDLMNNTYNQVESIINGIVNALLNNFAVGPFHPNSSNFTSSEDEVNGYMEYNIPSMPSPPVTDPAPKVPDLITPEPTSQGSPATINGSAVVQTRLVFNSSSPVPSKSEVLSAIEALLNSTLTNLTDLVTVLNITYEEISNASYAVIITFKVSNISIPTNPDLMNNTYNQVESIINGIVNVLLKNYTTAVPLVPSTSNFMSSDDEVNGYMVYNIPSMHSPPGTDTAPTVPASTTPMQTTPGPSPTIYNNGLAVVQTRLVFNSPSPVPSTSEVLSFIEALLNSTLTNLADPVTVLNITYEEISNTSNAVIITFKVNNISIPTNPDLMNNTYNQVESIINGIANALLNNFAVGPFHPNSSNFTSSEYEVNGYMEYNIPSMPSPPVTDPAPKVPDLITPEPTSQGSPATINGSAVVQTRLVFNSSSPVPSKSEVLSAIEALLNSTLTNLTDLVPVLNITYEEISNASYAVIITFKVSNISIPTNPDLMNNTYNQVESIINGIVNVLLKNYSSAVPLQPSTSNFTSSEDEVNGYMEYNIPSMPSPPVTDPSVKDSSTTKTGTVLIYIKLIFQNLIIVPPETLVLKTAVEKLESKIRRQRDTATQTLDQPVSIQDIIYTKTGNNSFSLDLAFKNVNVNLSNRCDTEFNNKTYEIIQNEINGLMNTILSKPQTPLFTFPPANFTCNDTEAVIVANVIYVYKEGDIQSPSSFLLELLKESGLLYYTLPPLVSIEPHNSGNSTNTSAAWILGIVIPCGIVIILLPCWILLCCLLCGCCARIRRRWRRRQSYNVQYQTHNSLF
ncbi:uncharacterized threonine-rich GPI-anchored glycoprotein PJ4664.02-like isoform X13 [Tachysurus fulvidraco]|uniref:uncharacterized threonine-rich GPI-anchored glycoprotein PJ4664.02-like isoform X13 n=1 Tax=Tachysurus fulvidraco TaxID=1234273 RepID=UPI001FED82C1|nr:uncharacterized threonine-rich GPI-anchored glycoprotein PJ4664.02-like isoform X13 [Tachysurus fulvidraco]